VNVCVLNQSHGHRLLFDALHVAITMALKLKEEFKTLAPSMVNLMEDDMVVALPNCLLPTLPMIASNIRKQIYDVLDVFLSFLMKYEKKENP